MENVQIMGSLILSGIAIIASAMTAIIPPLYNHKKTKQYDKQWDVIAELYKKHKHFTIYGCLKIIAFPQLFTVSCQEKIPPLFSAQ